MKKENDYEKIAMKIAFMNFLILFRVVFFLKSDSFVDDNKLNWRQGKDITVKWN